MVDTSLFDLSFKAKLLNSIDDLDEQTDGLIIHGDNFQALNLMQEKYQSKVDTVYIDPPYNTSASEILYKNGYKHSSWLSLIHDRNNVSRKFLKNNGLFCVTIDDLEVANLQQLMNYDFGKDNNLGNIVIRNNPSGRSTTKGVSIAHEYALIYGKGSESQVGRLGRNEAQTARYNEEDQTGKFEWVNFRKHGGTKEDAPSMFYPIIVSDDKFRLPEIEWDAFKKEWIINEVIKSNEIILYPIDENGLERRWKWGVDRFKEKVEEFKVDLDRNKEKAIYLKARMNDEGVLCSGQLI